MKRDICVIKKTWWLMILSLLLFFINIDKTYLLIQDTARDSVRMIQIWQNKELTLIGPPASIGQRSTREFYLGSLSYYFGIFGLLVTNFQAWGAIIIQVLIFVTSIPVAYLLFRDELKLKRPLLGVFLYVVSPLALIHLRFYWNPNAILGLSTWFWYLALRKREGNFSLILSGIILGIIFNLHYFAVLPLFLWLVFLAFSHKLWKAFTIFSGFVLGSSPIWIFELRNNFFLSKTFLFNLTEKGFEGINLWKLIGDISKFPLAILGVRPMEISYAVIFNSAWQSVFGWLVLGLMIFTIVKLKGNNRILVGILIVSIIITSVLSGNEFYGRYLFGLYPIFIWFVFKLIENIRWLWFPLFLLIFIADWKIISFRPDPSRDYVGLNTLEKASELIKNDVGERTYNLSENIYGDAQARGLRFYVLKNVEKKPEDELSYEHLDILYVLTPSLEKTIEDNRYEFYTPNLRRVEWVKDLEEVKLYKFVAEK